MMKDFLKITGIVCAAAGVLLLLLAGTYFYTYEAQPALTETDFQGLCVSHVIEDEKESTVNWWLCEETGVYYLFLPTAVNEEKLRVGILGTETITVDGNKISNGDYCVLGPGEHDVYDEEGTHYPLRVIKSSGIGSVFVWTESGSMEALKADKLHEESGRILITDKKGGIQYRGVLEKIHGRGNSSWYDGTKLPWAIKLPKKTDLFHMGAARKWNLLSNESDGTMLRNKAVFHMAEESGVKYVTESEFVDFYANGEYQGTYQLTEKVEVNPERVAISDLEKETQNVNPEKALKTFPLTGSTEGIKDTVPNTQKSYDIPVNPHDITGSYLITQDIGYAYLEGFDESGFVSARNQAVDVEAPRYASTEQIDYIASFYQEFEDAIYDWDGVNQDTGKHYYEYMDLDSFSKKYLVEEISKNLDASIASQYMYKLTDDVSDKLFAGPPWDYDKSLGNGGKDGYNSCDLTDPGGLYASEDVTGHTIWYAVFFRPEFHAAVLENYYGNFRENALEEANVTIDEWAEKLQNSVIMNAIRWNRYRTVEPEEISVSYQQEVNGLKDFIRKRIAFLDETWQEEKSGEE